MESRVSMNGSWQVRTLSGRLTQADKTDVMDILKTLTQDENLGGIRLDISHLTFVDSFGIGLLLMIRDEAARLGRRVVIRGAQGPVEKLFRLSGLDSMFESQASAAVDLGSGPAGVLTVQGPQMAEDGVHFILGGRFTFATHPPFFDITEYLTRHRCTVHVDLSGLDYMDSSAVSMMVLANDAAKQSGGTLIFHNPTGRVARLFDLTNLWDTLNVQRT